ncbi:glutathione S-transferase N-terminal domain-containing protein [Halomicrococcus sp. SG-WS-1]|uniref:glutathione S-transferase N-terminal domain-containing protein n=1 Tax=Halomicrococcus sp. SG-WS-1 TaxID=3439057 RepID=UPI003F7A20D5
MAGDRWEAAIPVGKLIVLTKQKRSRHVLSTTTMVRASTTMMAEKIATELLLFIGGLVTVSGLLGDPQALLSTNLYYVGGLALVTFTAAKGRPAIRSARQLAGHHTTTPAPDQTPGDDAVLELYQAEKCPYCQAVRRFCTQNGLSLTIHNPRTAGTLLTNGQILNQQRYDELRAHGQDQIPLLVDTKRDEVLYESDDIIQYLDNHYC